jgi:hypothetical protein
MAETLCKQSILLAGYCIGYQCVWFAAKAKATSATRRKKRKGIRCDAGSENNYWIQLGKKMGSGKFIFFAPLATSLRIWVKRL